MLFAAVRLSFVSEYFSAPLVGGFVTGVAVHVGVSQLDALLGIRRPRFSGPGYLMKVTVT